MDLKYIVTAADLATVPRGRTIVDFHAALWQRIPMRTLWGDGTGRERSDTQMITMRGPVYVLPEDFTGSLDLDDLSDAEPGDYVMDKFGDVWGKSTAGRWLWTNHSGRALVKTSAEMLAIYAPLLPAPRPGDTYKPMAAAAQQEEARPVGFWRRLWNGLVWG